MTAVNSAPKISRRAVLGGAFAGAAAVALASCSSTRSAPATSTVATSFDELDAKIEEGIKSYGIPGVAVAVLAGGQEHVKGYGVTSVDHPVPVDADTVFRIGSTTKTFTGTTLMRLIDQGKVDLDAPVRLYLPQFSVADPAASAEVTVRQLLNHSSGWLGDDLQDFGRGEDAVSRYVASMTRLPQLTAPGTVFAYNNSGLVVAGRIIEVVTGSSYETAVRDLLIDPLELDHTRFFSDQIVGFNVAASHNVVNGKAVVDPAFWEFPRSCNPTGSLISSARDQLRYARFHLGDGTAPDGTRLLGKNALQAMRSDPGPGGTLQVELTGMGLTWMLRPSAENETIVQHGGTWAGQRSGFFMVPSRGFAMTVLTNSEGGAQLTNDLFADDWALRRFAGLSNLPATAQSVGSADLAPFEGRYVAQQVVESGSLESVVIDFRGENGRLIGTIRDGADPSTFLDGRPGPDENAGTTTGLAFYRPDYCLDLDADGQPTGTRSNFVRGPDGEVAWFANHGRLYRRQ